MTDYGFYTQEELKDLNDSDLSFEISDAVILNVPDADADRVRQIIALNYPD